MGASRKRLIIGSIVVLSAFGLFLCAGAFAANPTSVSVSANIASTLQLNMPVTSITWSGPQEPGATVTGNISATINSNKAYALKVTKDHDLTGTGPTPETIPSANLTFGATLPTGGTYNAPAGTTFGTDTRVIEGARGSGLSTTITYSLTVPWDQAPDTYSATHVYTATQP